ncbi:hypothetical protein AGOR_G00251180 [Albula goreensis]|uniref:Uncharacterized protein n=1 Tax=Albula goreensis TaxID=1534307 RepID=A0A8T3CID6_9TELE|nr:hypothetical protein AGOR_G00251180 [Albula goreensis]
MIICYKKPSANGNTVCKSENGKTVCEARCTAGWAFPGGKTSITSTCSQQPCKSFTPPSCSGCADNRGCKGNEVCKGGTCVAGCKANPCGRNTVCSTSNHVRKCACRSGWSGSNPVTGCNYRDLQWVSTSTIPANTVKSKSGHPVCRTKGEDGGLHGGWLYYTSGSYRCNYEYGWWEPNSRNYEVLVDPCGGKGVEWMSGAFWQNSVVVAKAVNWGINFYVCSAMDNKHIPGKLYLARNGWHCNVGYGGKGHKLASFHSLVQRPCY